MDNMPIKISPDELAFDIDGVIADTFKGFVSLAKSMFNLEIQYEDMTEYNMTSFFALDDQTKNAIVKKLLDEPLEIGIKPLDGSVAVLKKLLEYGPVILITARPKKESIASWVTYYLEPMVSDKIKLEATGNCEGKIPLLLEYGVKYFIEDRLETCYLLSETPIVPIVFEQPWNRKPHPFLTVKSWQDIDSIISWE